MYNEGSPVGYIWSPTKTPRFSFFPPQKYPRQLPSSVDANPTSSDSENPVKAFYQKKLLLPYQDKNCSFQAGEEILSCAYTMYPQLLPYLNEIYQFDKATFKHSVYVADIAVKSFIKYAKVAKLSQKDFNQGVISLIIGGLLHDVGKLGLSDKTLEESWEMLYPERRRNHTSLSVSSNQSKNNVPKMDGRTDEERKRVHLHNVIGGYMVQMLLDKECPDMSTDLKHLISQMAFNHHESAFDTNHDSYARTKLRLERPINNLYYIYLRLADVAVAMTERRPNRNNQSLGITVVAEEIESMLSDKLLSHMFQTDKEDALSLIRQTFVQTILSSLAYDHDEVAGMPDTFDPMNIFGFNGNNRIQHGNKMESLISSVWDMWGPRLAKTMER